MNRAPASRAASPPPLSDRQARLLKLARGAWVVLALALLVSLIASLPPYLASVASRPTSITVADADTTLALLAEIGLAPGWFTLYRLVWQSGPSLLYLGLGLLLFLRRPRDPGALLMAAVFVINGTQGGQITPVAGHSPPHTLGEALPLAFGLLNEWAVPLAFYLLPDGRFVPRWTRWLALALLLFLAPHYLLRDTPFDPYTYPTLLGVYGIGSIVTFVYAPLYRYFRVADAAQRQQLKWALAGILATPLAWVISLVVHLLFPAVGQPTALGLRYELAYMAWSLPLYLLGPLGIGFAVLRYRLWDIDVIIRRTLVYSVLSAVLALIYFGSVIVIEGLLRGVLGGNSPFAIVLSTLVIAALFGPLRARVQRTIDRRFYRRKYDAARTLAAFGAQARDVVELEQLEGQLVQVVDETMQPASVGLWVRKRDR
jgi:hypothetical protein